MSTYSESDGERVTADKDAFRDASGKIDANRIRGMHRSLSWDTCASIRQAMARGEYDSTAELARADNEIDASPRTIQKHARGGCNCPVDEPELVFVSGEGWAVVDEPSADE